MGTVNCLYCGKKISDEVSECPHCGAISHYQKRGYLAGAKKKFVLWFLVLVVVCVVAMLWLPR